MSAIENNLILREAQGKYLEQTIRFKNGTEQKIYIIKRWTDSTGKLHYCDLSNKAEASNSQTINDLAMKIMGDQPQRGGACFEAHYDKNGSCLGSSRPNKKLTEDIGPDLQEAWGKLGKELTLHEIKTLLDKSSKENEPKRELGELLSKPPVPITNNGATCYMNAVLQMALNDSDFFHHFIAHKGQKEGVKKFALSYFKSQLQESTEVKALKLGKKVIHALSKQFKKSGNHDATEALNSLFPNSVDNGGPDNPFKVTEITKITYDSGTEVDSRSSSSFFVHVPLPEKEDPLSKKENIDFAKLLKHGEVLKGDSVRNRHETSIDRNGRSREVVEEVTFFEKLPKKLICDFKRFTFEDSAAKNTQKVNLGLKFTLGKECNQEGKTGTYEITSFICHGSLANQSGFGERGTTESGHYITYVKKGEDWYQCDDSRITKIDNLKHVEEALSLCYLFNSQLTEQPQ